MYWVLHGFFSLFCFSFLNYLGDTFPLSSSQVVQDYLVCKPLKGISVK